MRPDVLTLRSINQPEPITHMPLKTPLVLLLLFFSCTNASKKEQLFIIEQNGKAGYINIRGEVVIPPVFYNAGEFSEGMAAVREGGFFGYVNENGKYVIQPQFHYATAFKNGLAWVSMGDKSFFIDAVGKQFLPEVYNEVTAIDSRLAVVKTTDYRCGVIDLRSKQLIVDTIFKNIADFQQGVAVVREYAHPGKTRERPGMGVINTSGKFVVPYGRYYDISNFSEGIAVVRMEDPENKEHTLYGAIDVNGNLLFTRAFSDSFYMHSDFHNGYASVQLVTYPNSVKEKGQKGEPLGYQGYINLKGELVLNNTSYRSAGDFYQGCAFVEKGRRNYILLDTRFQRKGNAVFTKEPWPGFHNNHVIVETENGYGIIDTAGSYIVQPQQAEIVSAEIAEGYYVYRSRDTGNSDGWLYGIKALNGTDILKPVMNAFDRKGFVNGLLKARVNEKLCYINKEGKTVWQQNDTEKGLKLLNIDYMLRGYFRAYSTPSPAEKERRNIWGVSDNIPHRIDSRHFLPDSLAVTIDIAQTDTFSVEYQGYRLYVSNTTADTIVFSAQDSRLYMKLQAKNQAGEWKYIEYLPSSTCGNSYHTVELEPGAYWQVAVPVYQGVWKTNIRAELSYPDKNDSQNYKTVYSNIITGSVNPGQFSNKMEYTPQNVMDPYYD